MKEEFIALQIKRIRRNIIILIVVLTLLSIFIAFYRGIGLMILSVVFFVFIMGPVRFIRKLKSIKIYSVNKALSVYGYFYDVAQYINNEILRGDSVRYGNVIITDSWILKLNTFSLDIIKIDDIVWAYQQIIRHKQGVIMPGVVAPLDEVGKTFAVIINSKNPIAPTIRINTTHMSYMDKSKEVEIEGVEKQQRMLNILDELEKRNSYAIYEYSSDLSKIWDEDRDRFIKLVMSQYS